MKLTINNCLSGNQLKILGVILMTFDHLGAFLTLDTPIWFGWLGRPVAIIFLFLSSEGFRYTRNKSRYAGLLLVGFWLMSFGNVFFSSYFVVEGIELYANIFGALFLGILYMFSWDLLLKQIYNKNRLKAIGVVLLMLVPFAESLIVFKLLDTNVTAANILLKTVPTIMATEGGVYYVLMALLFYIFRAIEWAKYLVIVAFSAFALWMGLSTGQSVFMEHYGWMAIGVLIPIFMYSGEKGGGSKYFFYIFYPAHIFIIYMISYLIQIGALG